jgi:hypothetical protein
VNCDIVLLRSLVFDDHFSGIVFSAHFSLTFPAWASFSGDYQRFPRRLFIIPDLLYARFLLPPLAWGCNFF